MRSGATSGTRVGPPVDGPQPAALVLRPSDMPAESRHGSYEKTGFRSHYDLALSKAGPYADLYQDVYLSANSALAEYWAALFLARTRTPVATTTWPRRYTRARSSYMECQTTHWPRSCASLSPTIAPATTRTSFSMALGWTTYRQNATRRSRAATSQSSPDSQRTA